MEEKERENLSLETRMALTEAETKNNSIRITKHKEEHMESLDKIVTVLDKVQKILWEDGLVNSVRTNTAYIQKQANSKDKLFNYALQVAIFIVLSFVALKTGLK